MTQQKLLDIFDRFSHEERKISRSVCRRWRVLLDNHENKYFVFRAQLNNESMEGILNSEVRFKEVHVENFTQPIPTNPHFPQIQRVVIDFENSEENISIFVKKGCEDSTSLHFSDFYFSEIGISQMLEDKTWPKLSRLHLGVRKFFKNMGIPNQLIMLMKILI